MHSIKIMIEEHVTYQVVKGDIVRKIQIEGRGITTSKLAIPDWVDKNQSGVDIYDLAWLSAIECPHVDSSVREIRAVDLFCGCGGLTLGIREAALGLGCTFRSVFASDINKATLDIYAKNFQPDTADNRPIENSIDGELGAALTEAENPVQQAVPAEAETPVPPPAPAETENPVPQPAPAETENPVPQPAPAETEDPVPGTEA